MSSKAWDLIGRPSQRNTGQRWRQGAQTGAMGHGTNRRACSATRANYSPTDPDVRIRVKPGNARALNYLCSLAVDTAHGVISHVQGDLADQPDSFHLPRLLSCLRC